MKQASSIAWLLFSACIASGCAASGDDAATGRSAGRVSAAIGQTQAAVGTPAQTHAAQSFTPLANVPISASLAQLLTDGRVIAQALDSNTWWTLTPDNTGSYLNGTWAQVAAGPSGYSPLYLASAVLPDGRFFTAGGEYIAGTEVDSGSGAVYDPTMDMWTPISLPSNFSQFGDAQSVVLANGSLMVADCCTTAEAILDATNLTWTPTGSGKEDINDEEGWTLLPDGRVLTVDANNTANLTESEIYDPSTGNWTSAGSTGAQLADLTAAAGGSHELGPAVLRADGTVIYTGATGHNAVFNSTTHAWSAAPDFPTVAAGQLDIADGPGALLPNGNVLFCTSQGVYQTGLVFFEWDGTQFNQLANATANAAGTSSFQDNMLVLPTGEVLVTSQSTDVEIYTPVAPTDTSTIEPAITSVPVLDDVNGFDPATISKIRTLEAQSGNTSPYLLPLMDIYKGRTYTVTGDRLNGVSQAGAYGDDAQASTAFPLVRFTNMASGHVQYARTHSGTNFAVGKTVTGSTHVDILTAIEPGLSQMQVVANGIASPALLVNVK